MEWAPKIEIGIQKKNFNEAREHWKSLPKLPRAFDTESWKEKNGITSLDDAVEQFNDLQTSIERDAGELVQSFIELDLTQAENFDSFIRFLDHENTQGAIFEKLYFFFLHLLKPRQHLAEIRALNTLFGKTYSEKISEKIKSLDEKLAYTIFEKLREDPKHKNYSYELEHIYRTKKETAETMDRTLKNSVLAADYSNLFAENGALCVNVTTKDNGLVVLTKKSLGENIPEISDPEDKEGAYKRFFDVATTKIDGKDESPLEKVFNLFLEYAKNTQANGKAYDEQAPFGNHELEELGGVSFLENMLDAYNKNERFSFLLDKFINLQGSIRPQKEKFTLAELVENPYPPLYIPYEGAADLIQTVMMENLNNTQVNEMTKYIFTHEIYVDPDSPTFNVRGASRHSLLVVGGYSENGEKRSDINYAINLAHEVGHKVHEHVSRTLGGIEMFTGQAHTAEVAALVSEMRLLSDLVNNYEYETNEEKLSVAYEEITRLFKLFFKNIEALQNEQQVFKRFEHAEDPMTVEDMDVISRTNIESFYKGRVRLSGDGQPDWILSPPLLTHKPYYRTSYTIATCVALHFIKKIKNNEPNAQKDYLEYLKENTHQNPKEIFLKYGIRLEKKDVEELFTTFADFFEEKLNNFEALLKKSKPTNSPT